MGNQITRSLVLNDFKRNKAINLTLFSFIFISALLMSTGALVIERLSGALDQIFEIAEPPHYMQMHVGEVDSKAISKLAADSGLVRTFEIQDMVNIEGTNIAFTRQDQSRDSFSDSVMDNYFVMQNKNFDYLLDLNNQMITVNQGEVGVPISYAKQKNIQVGDQLHVTVQSKVLNLKVAYLIRDAQMGSSLASSLRFVVNPNDFNVIKEHGLRHESIIAFRLHQESDIETFSNLYQQDSAKMPKNGVAITLPLIRLINGIGDGLMSGVIILVGIILIGIAILNIRFTVYSTLEDDVKTIGTLKAIGLKDREINHVYKSKYKYLSIAACLLAALLSFTIADVFLYNIALNFGVSETTLWTYLIPFIAVTLLHILIMGSLNRILKAVSKMTIIEALSEGMVVNAKKKQKPRLLSKLKPRFKQKDIGLGLHLYKNNLKPWLLFIIVFFLSTFSILLPLNLYMTMGSPEFTNYVGAAKSDIRISVEYSPQLENMISDIERQLGSDSTVAKWHEFRSLKGKIETNSGGEKLHTTFLMESGDYSDFPIKMEAGYLPVKPGEIALSTLNQNRLGLELNDLLEVSLNGKQESFKVVGIYQDITNGGLTAKISDDYVGDIAQYAFFVNVSPKTDKDLFAETWSKQFPNAKVIPVDKLLDQTLGTITASLGFAVIAVFFITMAIVALISVLFVTLQMQKRHSEDAMLLAIGFEETAIRHMYVLQSGISMVLGILLGASASLFLGEAVMSLMLSLMAFGLTSIKYLIQPASFIMLGCLAPLAVGLVLTWWVTGRIAQTHVMELGNE